MEMSNQACQSPGLKLGHEKTRGETVKTTAISHNSDASSAAATVQKRIVIPNYTPRTTYNSDMRGNFQLPGYEPSKLQSLPAAPQTLFQKEQLLGMLDDFSKHMYDAIMQNGISVPPSIDLGLNPMGDISLLGNHPDQFKIEDLFSNNSPLALQFHQIAFTSRLQQLAKLQPGFRGEFFNFPNNSIQQITFVHMRAVDLQAFRMTIDQAEVPNETTLDKQIPRGEFPPFHLVISRPGEMPAWPSASEHQTPLKPEENIYTIDEPEPPSIAQDASLQKRKHHHEHEGRMRCAINEQANRS